MRLPATSFHKVLPISRRRKAKTDDNASVTKKPVMMVPLSQSSDNPSFNDDEDEATNIEDTLPAAKSGSTLERRRSSGTVYLVRCRLFELHEPFSLQIQPFSHSYFLHSNLCRISSHPINCFFVNILLS